MWAKLIKPPSGLGERQLFKAINSVAKSAREELESRLKEIRKGAYAPWNLNAILGVTGSSAAKKIASAGTANAQ